MSTRENSKAPKLRSSCDACQALKIKCGQEKPSCRRCRSNRLDCVYGISRRMGKPRSCSRAAAAGSGGGGSEQLPTMAASPQREDTIDSGPQAGETTFDDDARQWPSPPMPLWNADAVDLLSNGSDPFEDFSGPRSIASSSDDVFMADHCGRYGSRHVELPATEDGVLSVEQAVTAAAAATATRLVAQEAGREEGGGRRGVGEGEEEGEGEGEGVVFTELFDQPTAGPTTLSTNSSSPSSSGSTATTIPSLSVSEPFNALINHLSPHESEARQSCDCYIFALQSLGRLERVSKSHCDLVFDTILAFTRETLCRCFNVLECTPCLANSSCLLIYSLLVGKISLLCQAGCSAYGIYKGLEKDTSTRPVCSASALKVGNYEIRGEEEKFLVSVLMQRRLREVSDFLGRLDTAVQKLPHNRESNACRDVVADAYQKLGFINGCSGM